MNDVAQRRLHSFIEATLNTGAGFLISIAAGLVVYPMFGHTFRLIEVTGITAIFTVLSIARSYIVRRLFNWMHQRGWR
jgi:hypothetical protein